MTRRLFAALGIVMALFPDRVLSGYERIAFEAPEEAAARAWIPGAIRGEGLAFALAGVMGGAAHAWLLRFLGVVGAFAAIAPRQYLALGGRVAYERSTEVRWRSGFVTAARGLGVLCVALAIRGRRERAGTESTE
jgi:hypothetical protein